MLSACSAPKMQATALPSSSASIMPSLTPETAATAVPSNTPIPVTELCSPLLDHSFAELFDYITQPFIAPLGENRETGHHGVDIAYFHRAGDGPHIEGTTIQSVLNGQVAGFGYNPVYGNYIILESAAQFLPDSVVSLYSIEEGQSIYQLFAHMEEPTSFVLGDNVECAMIVGRVSDSGDQFFVSDPHLHFEIRVGPADIQFGPMSFYDTLASEQEKAEYMFWRTDASFALHDPMLLINLAAEN